MIEYIKRKAGPFKDAGQTRLPFNFVVLNPETVTVEKARGDLEYSTRLEYLTDFTVELNKDQQTTPGGTVVLTAPIEEGEVYVILSAAPYTQTLQLTNFTRFPPEAINDALDRQEIQIQQLAEGLERSVFVPPTSDTTPQELVEKIFKAREDSVTAASNAALAQEKAESAQAKAEEAQQASEAARDESQRILESVRTEGAEQISAIRAEGLKQVETVGAKGDQEVKALADKADEINSAWDSKVTRDNAAWDKKVNDSSLTIDAKLEEVNELVATAKEQAGIAETQAGIATTKSAEALASADKAKTSEINSKASEDAAKESEANAAKSSSTAAEKAEESRSAAASAKEYENKAAESATSAEQSKTSAAESASSAAQAKTYAQQAASSAGQSKTSAEQAASTANQAKIEAAEAAASAKESENKASESATSAEQSKTSAGESASSAAQAKTDAMQAASAAGQSKTSAEQAASTANQAKTVATEAAASAKESESKATESATSAEQSKSSAADSASSAAQAASSAAQAKSEAEQAAQQAAQAASESAFAFRYVAAEITPNGTVAKTSIYPDARIKAGDHLVDQNGSVFRILSVADAEVTVGPLAGSIKGDKGDGLIIRSKYPTLDELKQAHPTGNLGDYYSVGKTEPYIVYFWDEEKSSWESLGMLQGAEGPQGPQGIPGPQGLPGADGQDGAPGRDGAQGAPGADGKNGATFRPTVSADGTLSFQNDQNLPNPDPVNIRGPQGPQGLPGADGQDGAQGEPGKDGTTPAITASATVDATTGTPSVVVTKGGTLEEPSFAFAFTGLMGKPGTTTWSGITDKPAEFPPEAHNHVVEDFTGLQDILDDKIAVSGNRGELAGYETARQNASVVQESSPDSQTAPTSIAVKAGRAGTTWTKVVYMSAPPSEGAQVNIEGMWSWVGGSAPEIKTPGLLVCHWNDNAGILNYVSGVA